MSPHIRPLALALALFAALPVAGVAQSVHIPPHSNDPSPPTNQPAYQLRTPLSRPGVPGYPGAPHSNDPSYTRTEPGYLPPGVRITPNMVAPPLPRITGPQPTFRSAPLVYTERRRAGRRGTLRSSEPRYLRKLPESISIDRCYRNWDPGTRMSRSSWDATCRRLSSNGRVPIR